ncbi:hypothetical protein AVEN_53399-1 [Araneus ventricosus]|uniref:Uncharacterized protein n=1 Tax=Araneus ventricosus TaxID=182803 RepID=A0A4Y2AA12_ARAVE|nr:hypothetical protein AVEN_53399-1 [Araneus ventricosus]
MYIWRGKSYLTTGQDYEVCGKITLGLPERGSRVRSDLAVPVDMVYCSSATALEADLAILTPLKVVISVRLLFLSSRPEKRGLIQSYNSSWFRVRGYTAAKRREKPHSYIYAA